MLFIVISMLVIVAVAGLVVALVALPHRSQDTPGVPWLDETLGEAVVAMPTPEPGVPAEPAEEQGAHH